eukprot:TRINITY_DN90542_c0_g1_i1.p1 TRINITY_DN90542_c0_g1~~TRINITY_DN90542_c0_g1_i1.p1  ORF type:complete len:504 (+),score=129.55 TRINITY_DN90542_c0_g1_i1:97-1608(+)
MMRALVARRGLLPRQQPRRGEALLGPLTSCQQRQSRGFVANLELRPMTRCVVELTRRDNKPGSLNRILGKFEKYNIDLTHIESKLHCFAYDGMCFQIDMRGAEDDPKIQACLQEVRLDAAKVVIQPAKQVPWFPTSLRELDDCVTEVIGAGDGGLVDPDHPGFNDAAYMKRREELAAIANSYRYGDKLEDVVYTEDEVRTWGAVYERLEACHKRWACDEYNEIFPDLAKYAGYGPRQIPQLGAISEYCKSKTGFQLRPVCGLLSARDFLNALAFRTFCSTQYIRHGGNPFYTPEPDICHELIGHVPLLADPHFADFTQEVGLASLGASDEDIVKLASIYWFTVEFGLIKSHPDPQGKQSVKVMGAGILSSFGEMEWSVADAPSEEVRENGGMVRDYPDLLKPQIMDFDPRAAADQPYPITTYQPIYFCGESMQNVKDLIADYCDGMERSFHPVYDPLTQTVVPSRHVRRLPRSSTADMQAAKQKEYFDKLATSKENYNVAEVQ